MIDFSHYKAVLFDVDKTLTNSSREVTVRTKESIQKLSSKGYIVGASTGRHFLTISQLLQFFPVDSLHISCGGGQLIRQDGSVISTHPVPIDIAERLISLADLYHARILFQGSDEMYGNAKAIEHAQNYFLTQETFRIPTLLTESVALDQYALVTIGDVDDALIGEVSKLPVTTKVMTNYSGRKYIDITALGITKATGVQEWSTIQGINPTQIIGFGDSENDLEFLQTIGYAVAMGNATDQIKQIADEVTDDCDHDGVAQWIEKRILG